MTSVKAKLAVILKANDVVVAEVNDARLWQRVFTAISDGEVELQPETGTKKFNTAEGLDFERVDRAPTGADTQRLKLFVQKIGAEPAVVEGACAPSEIPPYMHLDSRCWEEMRRELPRTGPIAVPPIALSATLLVLWFGVAGLRNPTQAQAQAVLDTIKIRDRNPSRGIRGASWLQSRPGGEIVLNPAQVSRAIKFVKCFCSKDWAPWKDTGDSKN